MKKNQPSPPHCMTKATDSKAKSFDHLPIILQLVSDNYCKKGIVISKEPGVKRELGSSALFTISQ